MIAYSKEQLEAVADDLSPSLKGLAVRKGFEGLSPVVRKTLHLRGVDTEYVVQTLEKANDVMVEVVGWMRDVLERGEAHSGNPRIDFLDDLRVLGDGENPLKNRVERILHGTFSTIVN